MNITFEKLQKSYDGRKVLDIEKGLIKSGSRTAIIGPNGAGKSTLLKILAGLENADKGFVNYGSSSDFPQSDVTMVFQKPYLISTTVEKNIAYPMKLRGFSDEDIEKRVTELSEDLGLAEFRKQKSWKLSGGETQKVALARALSFKPKLLLLDEPTANVDPYTTAEIEKMLISASSYATIVLITHNLAQAKRVCDQAMLLHEGKLIENSSCFDMLTSPKTPEARKFIEGELLLG
ncbi:MAG: ATP-binding cassette domain-containing protein [Bacillota bacterium]|nr:ATP-binding cassette domain-containing protein [Bacillota bacterium]